MNRAPAFLLAVFLLYPAWSPAGEPADSDLGFAERLFEQRDYYRAITEYKRYLFKNPGSAKAPWVEFRIGESYLAGGKTDAAVNVFEGIREKDGAFELKQHATLAIARAFYQQGRLDQSAELIDRLLPKLTDPGLSGYAWYLSGCVSLKAGGIEKSQAAFKSVYAGHRLAPQALWLSEKLGGAQDLPTKSPVLAGLLSVVPGLGHVYLGEYAIAITAFAWNGVFGFATYDTFRKGYYGVGSLLAALSLLWYSGTIYGAISGAQRYNQDARLNFHEYLDAGAGLDVQFPDPGFAGSFLISGSLP